jgi:hypothetical protein
MMSASPAAMTSRRTWARIALLVGYAALLIGAVDPLEGSLAILAGAGLVVLGNWGAGAEEPWRRRSLIAFVLIVIGVGAVWGLSAVGGIGGRHGQPVAWAVLLPPYPVGWCLLVLGRGAPRWVAWGVLVLGALYVALPAVLFLRPGRLRPETVIPLTVLSGCGLLLLAWAGRRAGGASLISR